MDSFLLTRKTFSWNTRYVISEREGPDVFEVISNFWGNALHFKSMNNHELYTVKRKFWSSRYTHKIYVDNREIAEVKYLFNFKISPRYEIYTPEGMWLIKGNKWARDYVIMRDDQIICEIMENRKTWWVKDYYVNIYEGENVPFLLCCVMTMDRIRHKRRQASGS